MCFCLCFGIWTDGDTDGIIWREWSSPSMWRNIQRVGETKSIQNVEVDIFCQRDRWTEVSSDMNQLKGAILLFDKENRRWHWRLRGLNLAGLQVLLQEYVQLLLLSGQQQVDFATRWFRSGYKLHGVIPFFGFRKDIESLFREHRGELLKVLCVKLWEYPILLGWKRCGVEFRIGKYKVCVRYLKQIRARPQHMCYATCHLCALDFGWRG